MSQCPQVISYTSRHTTTIGLLETRDSARDFQTKNQVKHVLQWKAKDNIIYFTSKCEKLFKDGYF